jgi:hypothetical protein
MERVLSVSGAIALLFLVASCGPGVPAESEARAWLETDSAKINAIDAEARRYIVSERLLGVAEDGNPMRMEIEMSRERARATFREVGLPRITQEAGALGLQLRLLDGTEDTGTLAGAGTPDPVRKDGNVAAADGAEVDGRKLGWGVYGIDGDDGVREVRGYEVSWEVAIEGRTLGFQAFMQGS